MTIFDHYQARYESTQEEEYSVAEFLEICKTDKSAYASAPERLLMAIGEPKMLDYLASINLAGSASIILAG